MFHPMAFTVVIALLGGADAVADVRAGGGRAVRHRHASRRRRTASCAGARTRLPPGAGRCALRRRWPWSWRGRAAGRAGAACWPRAWAASSSRASTRATSPCTRCASPAPASTQAVDDAGRARARASSSSRGRATSSPRSAPPRSPPTRCRRASPTRFVMLKPREEWPDPRKPKAELVRGDRGTPSTQMPGNNYEFTQPIQMRFNELISGVRTDVAVKVYGDDLDDAAARSASRSTRCSTPIPGAADVKVEQVTGLPVLTITLDRDALARYGLNVADVQAVVETAVGGTRGRAGLRGRPALRHRRAPARSAARPIARLPIGAAARLPLPSRAGDAGGAQFVPLREVATLERRDRARTRSAARTASGASSSPPTCAAATSARFVAEAAATQSTREVEAAGGLLDRATAARSSSCISAQQAPAHRRAASRCC